MAQQPPAPSPSGSSPARTAAITVATQLPAATSAAGGAAGVAAGFLGSRKLIAAALKAIDAVHKRIAALRLGRMREALGAAGVAPDDVERALREEKRREVEFRKRAENRVRKGLRIALAADDASARAAGVEAVLRREQQYARQRAAASADRLFAAVEREQLRIASPQGAYWQLGHAAQHTPDCLAMAGRFWPWSVLDKVHPLLHVGCVCRLRSMGDAIAEGLMTPADIVPPRKALGMARPVIDYLERGHALEEAAAAELDTRIQLLESGHADRNALAAMPLEVDAVLLEGDQPTGAMVALYPPAEVAAALSLKDASESADDLHVTLCFMGNATAGPKRRDQALAAVRRWAKNTPPLTGVISGAGRFVGGPKPVTYLSVDLPELPGPREKLVKALDAAGVPPKRDHGYTPHMTLDYAKRRPPIDKAIPVTFAAVTLAWGAEQFTIPLEGEQESSG